MDYQIPIGGTWAIQINDLVDTLSGDTITAATVTGTLNTHALTFNADGSGNYSTTVPASTTTGLTEYTTYPVHIVIAYGSTVLPFNLMALAKVKELP